MDTFLWIWIAIALILLPIQLRVTAPYGRHGTDRWGPVMSNRLGWVVMEVVSLIFFSYFFLTGSAPPVLVAGLAGGLFMGHYFHRSLVFPFRTRTRGKTIPVSVVLSAVFFNAVNGSVNGWYIGEGLVRTLDSTGSQVLFGVGLLLFLAGMRWNLKADYYLIGLRREADTGYQIPRGGLFERISCPNHFGEIVQWTGFAVMCGNLAAFSFLVWTISNLIPRSLSHHRWYRENFPDYPIGRKAVIPYVL